MTPADLSALIVGALGELVDEGLLRLPEGPAVPVAVERSPRTEHGDYATNVALRLARPAGLPPRRLARLLASRLAAGDAVASVDVAGAGFLNVRLVASALGSVAARVVRAGPSYGSNVLCAGQDVRLRLAAGGPIGPVLIADARTVAVGDALGRILESCGARVTRECHLDDHRVQVDRFDEFLAEAGPYDAGAVDRAVARPTEIAGTESRDRTLWVETAQHGGARRVEVLAGGVVDLVRDGSPLRTSRRSDPAARLEELVEAVGVDAARYALTRYALAATIDIDLDLWARQSSDNPAYSVRYAHARLASVLRNAADLGLAPARGDAFDPTSLDHPAERGLLSALAELPGVVSAAGRLREPRRVARYLEDTAAAFYTFHDTCRVLPSGDEAPSPKHAARLLLVDATRVVLANGLRVLGVSAPERM